MSTITFTEWGFGLDLRQGASTSDANRLRVLKNAYITDGKRIRKRNGFTHVATLQPGTVGMFAGGGVLNTFQIPVPGYPLVTHANPILKNNELQDVLGIYDPGGIFKLAGVLAIEMFNGIPYVAAQHWDNHVTLGPVKKPLHHYLDGAPATTYVTEAPQSPSIAKAASKIFSALGDVVKFSKTNDPRNWTLADDAGFLAVGLQQSGNKESVTCGNYQNRLVVFFPDSSQLWKVDPDPANHEFLTAVDIGTRLLYAHQNMNSDVFFMSPGGVRTITRQSNTESLIDSDVGSPIDLQLLKGQFIDLGENVKGQYIRATGQYWLFSENKAVVFTFSRSSKISAWSFYEFPFTLDYVDELDAVPYIRSGNEIYRMDLDAWTDGGTPYEVLVETAFADFKSPRVDKQITAMDAVFVGTGEISHRFDPRMPELITAPPVSITGDTQPGNTYPVELITTGLATVIRNFDDKEFEVQSISYEFQVLR